MKTGNEDFSGQSPDKLLAVFSKSRLFFWCIVAAVIHALVALSTSTGYVRDRWIDPDGAAARKAAASNAVASASGAAAAASATGAVASVTGAVASATGAVASAAGSETGAAGTNGTLVIDGQVVPDGATNSAVIQRITEVARPEDIPTQPGELGISMEDTRIR